MQTAHQRLYGLLLLVYGWSTQTIKYDLWWRNRQKAEYLNESVSLFEYNTYEFFDHPNYNIGFVCNTTYLHMLRSLLNKHCKLET